MAWPATRSASTAAAAAGWLDRLLSRRDRLLASRRFRQWAAGHMLTRWIARRRAAALFDLVAGFAYSQVLLACVRLGLFELLLDHPCDRREIAASLGLDETAAERLLRAAEALRLVERRRQGRYGLGPLGAPLAGEPGITALIEHHDAFYADLRDPVGLLRGRRAGPTALAAYWPYARAGATACLDPSAVDAYTATMSASQALVAEEVLGTCDLTRHRRLLDVGGGEGAFLAAAGRAAPHLELMLFDLPAVVARARLRLGHEGLLHRSCLVGGDFMRDELPTGADVVTLVRVLHDHDDAAALGILRNVARALEPGGRLLIAEPMAGREASRMADAYFGWYLYAMGSGRPRSPDELRSMLETAGFGSIRLLGTALSMQIRVLAAEKLAASDMAHPRKHLAGGA